MRNSHLLVGTKAHRWPAGGPGAGGRLEEVGITLERWARLRSVLIEYAEALRAYLGQEE
jgi:hypothetical protein